MGAKPGENHGPGSRVALVHEVLTGRCATGQVRVPAADTPVTVEMGYPCCWLVQAPFGNGAW